MAGGYTHLTLVRSAIRRASNNSLPEQNPSVPERELGAVLDYWGRYTYLGGVSPDYPYLGLDADWADLMHKGRTNSMITQALEVIFRQRQDAPEDQGWQQRFAWLLGFVSHVVADVVIHPVVNIKVGKYEENKEHHRICEMNQDVWIYKAVTGLDLSFSDNMKGEIRSCGRPFDLDDNIEDLWSQCLEGTYGEKPRDEQLDKWHAAFLALVDFAENSRKIPVFGRHLVSGGAAYPETVNMEYVENLVVPDGDGVDADEQPVDRNASLNFRQVFDKAWGHIEEAWGVLASDLFADELGEQHTRVFGDWSLDTGIDNASRRLHLWPNGKGLV